MNFYVKSHICVVCVSCVQLYNILQLCMCVGFICLRNYNYSVFLHGDEACLLKIKEEHGFENRV